ncbi:MAG: sigma 54-interacting transcriptional regulator [Rhodospirillum sp.]|nr:sigma 54-interacting transcriptional regulator [Rhodospirillum sp.]MCF8491080.1 sigma 54-interacting transcriptional regulator [Rhodospirillum sp.]MCF8500224.1 sigma 54-interacting transcriptional regulator [Rhodospirillum sp.]
MDRIVAKHVRFSPDAGHITLFGQRMLLTHAASFTVLRRELVDRLGIVQAREILTRIGYEQGFDDGLQVRSAHPDMSMEDQLAMGPRLREMEGFVRNHPVDVMVCDIERGAFWGDYYWSASWEAEAHLDHKGPSGDPACWVMVGYANGYTTAVTGIPVLWRELECRAMGHAHCRVIGRPLAEWGDLWDEDTGFLRAEAFVGLPDGDAQGLEPRGTAEGLPDIIGASTGFNAVARMVKRVASAETTVLFLGESGVGKERFARALHSISTRADKPFIAINCAAIPGDLVEAELFGVEKGAFTGADRSRPGRFERADGGILFLDEVASLPLVVQGKLLRVLQEREIERVGDTRVRRVDVRILAAANRDLRQEVEDGRFREDLFYRLNVFPITIPPLRERRDDIPLLVSLFLRRFARRGEKSVAGLTRRAHEALMHYDWPGNVRELENMVERGVILCDEGEAMDIRHLFAGGERVNTKVFGIGAGGRLVEDAQAFQEDEPGQTGNKADMMETLIDGIESLDALEADILRRALFRSGGNVSAAARLLGMGRGQFEYRIKKHGGV